MKNPPGPLGRIGGYLLEMYPPVRSLVACAFLVTSIHLLLSALHGGRPLVIGSQTAVAAATLFFFLLFLRVSDELKDAEVDKVMFPDRPFPSGRILAGDLYFLLATSVAAMLAVNGLWGSATVAFLALLTYGFLMLKYFFIPKIISKSLILALVTHNPSVLLMNLYVVALFANHLGYPLISVDHLLVITLFWLPGLAWELSRKIKAPADESAYVTYSKIFGYRVSAVLPMVAIGANAAILAYFALRLALPVAYLGVVAFQFLAFSFFFARFLLMPSSVTSKLRPIAEGYLVAYGITLTVALLLSRGLSLEWG